MSKWDAPKKSEKTAEMSRWNLDVAASAEAPKKSNFNSRWDKAAAETSAKEKETDKTK